MHYRLSKSQWQQIGMKAGWIKTASENDAVNVFDKMMFHKLIYGTEESMREIILSIAKNDAQKGAEQLAESRDDFIRMANSSRQVALADDLEGYADGYRFQLKREREQIEIANKISEALKMMVEIFPDVTVPPQKIQPMTEAESRQYEMDLEDQNARKK